MHHGIPSPSTTPAAAPAPVLVSAQGFGPYSATAAAAGAANVTWVKWRFTATPTSGAALVQEGDSPLVWWYNLAADTSCECRGVLAALSASCRPVQGCLVWGLLPNICLQPEALHCHATCHATC